MTTELHKPKTPAQLEAATLYEEIGSVRGVSRVLGKDHKTVRQLLQRAGVLKPAVEALREPTPGNHVKATSTLVDANGDVKLQWIKIDQDKVDKIAEFEQAVKALCAPAEGKAKPIRRPAHSDNDLMCVIPLGDPHWGQQSWREETGDDYDLKIAEQIFVDGCAQVVELAPAAHKCILITLGDSFHSDSQANTTARSGHQLDVDSRWTRVLDVGIRITRQMIEKCLEKFGEVVFEVVRGNHDDHTSVFLAHVMAAYFRNEPRVTVNMSPSLHHYFEFGKCFIGTHHGHTTKFANLPLLMAATQPEAWGRTVHRRVYCGHVHHDSLKEMPGCFVETMNTLAGKDAYASGAGYVSTRDIKIDTWHREHGLINRSTVGISRILKPRAA